MGVRVDDRTVLISTSKIAEVTVNFYRLDLELHFSTAPFRTLARQYNFVTPNESRSKEIKIPQESLRLPIPQTTALDEGNLVVEVIGRRSDGKQNIVEALTIYENTLEVQVGKKVGHIRVMNTASSGTNMQPVSKGYCKVYGRLK